MVTAARGSPQQLPGRGPLRLPLWHGGSRCPEDGGAAPRPLRGWGVVAGGIRGVWQGVPHPQQLRGQGQAQVAVRGRQPAEGGGAAAPAGQPQWVLPDTGEPDQARLLLAVGAPQRARLLGLGDTLPHPPPGERLALHLAPAHLPQPARPGGPLLRVGRGAVLPPRGALLHGRDEGGPSPHHARCGEEAITQVGQDRQLPPVLRGHVPAGGGLSHQPGPARNHQLLPPPDRDSRPGAGPCREGGKEQLRAGPSLSTAPRQTPGPHEGIGLGARRPGPGAWTWDS
ncbi:src-like-adapter 2 isoform X3 [Larus michahellis]|uniref:src-like-adapter 2 isoform X3 n=1 Tax=Larus michahellis TaxID=119627 RepID=UPI003D9B6D08